MKNINFKLKKLSEMTNDELEDEFEIYAAESGMDRELDYDYRVSFDLWLEENEILLNDEKLN